MNGLGKQHIAVLLLAAASLGACSQQMDDQPKYEAYEAAPAFPGNASARPPPPGTVPRGAAPEPVTEQNPYPVTLALLERGRARFDIFCAPCHGRAGDGRGMIVQRGFPAPPSYHTARLRAVSDRHIYEVITDGYGVMYSYAARVPEADRWAIIAWIRALQLSRHAPLGVLSEADRRQLGRARP
ncbi:MAG TPA: cytochrome c [Woeseiaceae bacterium]|nr:cytochrome c [Woeseiaceae bacterium]